MSGYQHQQQQQPGVAPYGNQMSKDAQMWYPQHGYGNVDSGINTATQSMHGDEENLLANLEEFNQHEMDMNEQFKSSRRYA